MTEPAESPAQLAHFPPDVHLAYRRYRATGDAGAVQTVVHAALLDYVPKQKRTQCPAVVDSTLLMSDLGYDSLAIAELVFFLEDLFKVTITTQEIRDVLTVGDLREFVAGKIAANRSSA